MDCEKARQKVDEYLRDKGLAGKVDQGQIDEAVRACCDDLTGQPCLNAMSSLAATAACVAYTQGVCIPCCGAAGKIVGPIIGGALGAAAVGLKSAWQSVSSSIQSVFGGGGCDYTPAAVAAISGYAAAAQQLGDALERAWSESRIALGLPPMDAVFSRDGPGGLWVPIADLPEDWDQNQGQLLNGATWSSAAVHNACVLYAHDRPMGKTWTVKGKTGWLLSPALDPASPPGNWPGYFAFTWSHYPCNESGNWQAAAADVCALRWQAAQDACDRLVHNISTELGREARVKAMDRAMELDESLSMAGERSTGSSGVWILAAVAAVSAAVAWKVSG